jgi:TonB family protein
MTQRSDFSALETDQPIGGVSDSAALAHATRSRRAVRIAVSLPVEIRDQFGGKDQPRTHFVMLRGCVLSTTLSMRVGNKLTLQNLKNGRTAECHAIGVEPGLNGTHQVEIEFTSAQPEFWPVQFPAEETRPSVAVTAAQIGNSTSQARQATPVSDKDLLVLADSVARDFNGGHAHSPERIATKVATTDSVAQFRAANRAAHKREQRKKAVYSAIFFAALSGAALGARYWFAHKPQLLEATPAPEVRKIAQKIARAIPAKESNAAQASAVDAADATESAYPEPSTSARPVVAAPSSASDVNAQLPQVPVQAAAESTQTEAPGVAPETPVAVRHGSSYAAVRKTKADDSAEEPVALPLRVAETASAAKPEALKDVVADVPAHTPVLAAPVPKTAVPAHLIRSVPAQYPSMARQLHVEGEVLLNVNVDPTGAVSNITVVSGPPLLRAAATDCVKRWKYQPAMLGDKPVASTEIVKLDFHWR